MRLIVFIPLFLQVFCFGQNISVTGEFKDKRIKFGQKTIFSLKVISNSNNQVLMPDASSDFQRFQLLNILTVPSRLRNDTLQIDSVAYELISFSLDSSLSLKLPVKEYIGNDSIIHYSNWDSLTVIQPDSLKDFMYDTTPAKIFYAFNYQLFLLITIIILILVYFFHNKAIESLKLLWKKLNQNKLYDTFLKEFEYGKRTLQQSKNAESVEKNLKLWKDFLSEISSKPINTYTPREIYLIYNDDRLLLALNNMDKCIYSGIFNEGLFDDIDYLLLIAQAEFSTLKNAKNE